MYQKLNLCIFLCYFWKFSVICRIFIGSIHWFMTFTCAVLYTNMTLKIRSWQFNWLLLKRLSIFKIVDSQRWILTKIFSTLLKFYWLKNLEKYLLFVCHPSSAINARVSNYFGIWDKFFCWTQQSYSYNKTLDSWKFFCRQIRRLTENSNLILENFVNKTRYLCVMGTRPLIFISFFVIFFFLSPFFCYSRQIFRNSKDLLLINYVLSISLIYSDKEIKMIIGFN